MAQETGLQDADMSKEEYISQLYALRAGLSVLSQETDKTVALQDEAVSECKRAKKDFEEKVGFQIEMKYYRHIPETSTFLFENMLTAGAIINQCKAKKGKLDEAFADVESKNKDFEAAEAKDTEATRKELKRVREAYEWQEKRKKRYTAGAIVSFLLFVCFIALCAWGKPNLHWIPFTIICIFCVGAGIGFVIFCALLYKEKKYEINVHAINKVKEKLHLKEERNKKTHDEFLQMKYNHELNVSKYIWGIEHAQELVDKIQAIYDQTNANIAVIQERCEQIYIMLQKQFEKLLDPRDWKYVDLVIFNYETGRAFTRQEALQLVDRETQTDRIVASVDRAAKYIGDCVKTATVMVTSAISTVSQQLGEMNRNMQGLASGMESVNTRIGALADVQTRQLEAANEQNAQIAALVSETNLNNALLAKSNQTSQQLMANVEYIRYYGTQN